MAQMSYEEFTKSNSKNTTNQRRVGEYEGPTYFSLKEDGDTAIVRFNISDINNLSVHSQHTVELPNKRFRKVECLRGNNEPDDVCPLCRAGKKPQYRIYLEMLVYEVVDNKIVAKPVVWEQSVKFRDTLKSYAYDYGGDLRTILFKLTRIGARGDLKTSYTLIPTNPQMYRDEDYIADFSAFNGFDIHKFMLLYKSEEELNYYLEHKDFPYNATKKVENNNVKPSYTEPQYEDVLAREVPIDRTNRYVNQQGGNQRFASSSDQSTVRDNRSEQSTKPSSVAPRRYSY